MSGSLQLLVLSLLDDIQYAIFFSIVLSSLAPVISSTLKEYRVWIGPRSWRLSMTTPKDSLTMEDGVSLIPRVRYVLFWWETGILFSPFVVVPSASRNSFQQFITLQESITKFILLVSLFSWLHTKCQNWKYLITARKCMPIGSVDSADC